jgi:hypothetical protein
MKSSFDEYKTEGGGRLVYLHFGQETPKEAEERQALFQRVADSLGVRIKVGGAEFRAAPKGLEADPEASLRFTARTRRP